MLEHRIDNRLRPASKASLWYRGLFCMRGRNLLLMTAETEPCNQIWQFRGLLVNINNNNSSNYNNHNYNNNKILTKPGITRLLQQRRHIRIPFHPSIFPHRLSRQGPTSHPLRTAGRLPNRADPKCCSGKIGTTTETGSSLRLLIEIFRLLPQLLILPALLHSFEGVPTIRPDWRRKRSMIPVIHHSIGDRLLTTGEVMLEVIIDRSPEERQLWASNLVRILIRVAPTRVPTTPRNRIFFCGTLIDQKVGPSQPGWPGNPYRWWISLTVR